MAIRFLQSILAIGCVVAFGIISVPGVHGGLDPVALQLLALIKRADGEQTTALVVYLRLFPAMIVFIGAPLIPQRIIRSVAYCLASFWLVGLSVWIIYATYPPGRWAPLSTGMPFVAMLILAWGASIIDILRLRVMRAHNTMTT